MTEREHEDARDRETTQDPTDTRSGSDDRRLQTDDGRSWEEKVELEGTDAEVSGDADLDPTLGYGMSGLDEGPQRRSRIWWWALLAVVALAVAGWWWWSERNHAAQTQATGLPSPAAEPGPQATRAVQLPELAASDEFIRRLVGEIAAHPALTRWLAHEGLVRRFVGAVEVVAEGEVPRDNLEFLVPDEGFQAQAAGPDVWRTASSSHQRFDELLSVMQLVDPADVARIVRTMMPLANEARRDLGYPQGEFRLALDRAIAHLVRVSPQLAAEPLVREGEMYLYQDATIEEGLSSAQKALLRLGPEQAAWVQAWLHRFHDALAAGG